MLYAVLTIEIEIAKISEYLKPSHYVFSLCQVEVQEAIFEYAMNEKYSRRNKTIILAFKLGEQIAAKHSEGQN